MAKRKVQQAKAALKSSGVTLNRLARTTGTTKAEVRSAWNAGARKMAQGGTTASDTAKLKRMLSGGANQGIPKTKASVTKAKKQVRQARRTYKAG
jgi:hypothetical protein